MILELDNEHVAEVFEILCGIPFEQATMHDTEPPTKRHAGIEQLIKQLDTSTEMAKSDSSLRYGTPDYMIIGMLLQACGDDAGNIDNHCMSAWEDACEYLHKKGLIEKVNDRMYKIDEKAYWNIEC